jgi:diguanylate cyclase (GGDEF)-like protein
VRRLHHVVSEPFDGLGRPAWMVTIRMGALNEDHEDAARGVATHDRLTGLASRELLLNRIADTVRRRSDQAADRAALVAVDLDRFRAVNDRYGTAVGDLVLRAVANRLTAVIDPGDFVSRTDGDEFAVLLAPRPTAEHLDVADRIAAFLGQPIEIDGVEHLSSPMIGVAEVIDGDDEHRLVAAAKEAASRALPSTPRLARRQLEQVDLDHPLRASLPCAVAEGQMFMHYQPIFSLPDRALVGLEALVRWEHPDDGLIAPDEFIAIADESGAIVPLGEWIVAEVCDQLAEWRSTADGYIVPPVSINVTRRQLADRDFRNHLLYEVATRGLETSAIRLEITERALVDHDAQVRAVVRQLADDGFAIDLDEFGTGLSSVTRLLDHPISGVKVARSVVAGLLDDERSQKLVLAAIEVGRALDLPVTAIGAEAREECSVLERWGCDRIQGFAVARPLGPIEASRFFHRNPDSMPERDQRGLILRSGNPVNP